MMVNRVALFEPIYCENDDFHSPKTPSLAFALFFVEHLEQREICRYGIGGRTQVLKQCQSSGNHLKKSWNPYQN
jgi:hypothetical protein